MNHNPSNESPVFLRVFGLCCDVGAALIVDRLFSLSRAFVFACSFFLLYFLYNRLLFHRYFIVRPLSIFGVYFSFCYVLSSCWLEFVSLFSYICIVCPLSLCCAPFLVRRKWFRSSCRNKIFPDLLSSEVTLFIFSSFWRTSNRHLLYFSSSTELFALRFLLFSQFYFVALVFLLRLFLSAAFQCGFFMNVCIFVHCSVYEMQFFSLFSLFCVLLFHIRSNIFRNFFFHLCSSPAATFSRTKHSNILRICFRSKFEWFFLPSLTHLSSREF